MGALKILIVPAILVSVILLGGLCFVYFSDDVANNMNITSGQYAGMSHFEIQMNWLISLIISNLGYVLAILIIVGMFLAAFAYMGYKYLSG